MAVEITLTNNGKDVRRQLKRIRAKSVHFAEKRMMETGGGVLKRELIRQWDTDMGKKRKAPLRGNFPSLLVSKAFSSPTRYKPAVVKSNQRVDDRILTRQIKGGIKKPKGKNLLVPDEPTEKRQKPRPKGVYKAGKHLFIARKGSDKGQYYATLAPTANVPKRWNIHAAVRRTEKRMPRLAERILKQELREAQRRRA